MLTEQTFCPWPNVFAKTAYVGTRKTRSLRSVPPAERAEIVREVLAGGGYERVGWKHSICRAYVQRIMNLAGARVRARKAS